MEKEQIKKGVNYIVKVGRNKIAVRLIQQNADGNYLVRNLRTGKPFFIPSEKAFVDFQNEGERQKALDMIAEETAPIVSKEPKTSNGSELTNTAKTPNDSKVSKRPQIMGHSKCAFVKALGKEGYKYYEAKKVLDVLGISMPPNSIKIQIYFGKNEKTWAKFGKPAELTTEQKSELEKLLSEGGNNDGR